MTKDKKVPQEKKPKRVCCASGDQLFVAIEQALCDREHVVMVRVSDAILAQLDMLVESGICKSRSSAATFMIREGIKGNAALFEKVAGATRQIATLKEGLRELVSEVRDDEVA